VLPEYREAVKPKGAGGDVDHQNSIASETKDLHALSPAGNGTLPSRAFTFHNVEVMSA